MAFKILDGEELDLLSGEQREQYEKELSLYQQRVAFVERLEELEKVRLEPYEPKLEAVYVTNEAEVKPFKKAEYKVSLCEPVPKPELQAPSYQKTEYAASLGEPVPKPDLQVPSFPKTEYAASLCEPVQKPDLQVPSFQKTEYVASLCEPMQKPDLQVPFFQKTEYVMALGEPVQRPDLQIVSFPEMEQVSPVLPDAKALDVPDRQFKRLEKVQPDIPLVSETKMMVEPFKRPETLQAVVPAVISPLIDATLTAITPIETSAEMRPSLPDVSVSGAGAIGFQKTEPIQPVLPETAFASPLCRADFQKPKGHTIDLPESRRADVSVPAVSKAEKVTPNLPDMPEIGIQERKFSRPEQPKPDLPAVSGLARDRKSLEKTVTQTGSLLALTKSVVYERAVESPEKKKSDIALQEPLRFEVKAFAKIERGTPGLPEISISEAPDAYSRFQDIMTSFKTGNGRMDILAAAEEN